MEWLILGLISVSLLLLSFEAGRYYQSAKQLDELLAAKEDLVQHKALYTQKVLEYADAMRALKKFGEVQNEKD